MKNGHDINKIHDQGYLIIPISMARISTGQSPKEVYKIVDHFTKKISTYSNDVILLYTGGLYFNSDKLNYKDRIKTNNQIIQHSITLRKMIEKNKDYIPGAFHYLPIDYVILNSKEFKEYFEKLKKLEKTDKEFKEAIKRDIGKREYSEATVNFILEEVVVANIIRQRLIDFPKTLVKNDIWRLIVYPGKYLESDLYQWKKDLLPKKDKINPFSGSQYDFSKKKLYIFDQI